MSEKTVWVRDGFQKTDLLTARALEGALDPHVREVAVRLVRNVAASNHVEKLGRLHRFARSHSYVREPIERFAAPRDTMRTGAGDCDDLVILLGALAWSLKYPFRVVPQHDPANPGHYTAMVGWPEASAPHGDADTRQWLAAESTPIGPDYQLLPLGDYPLAALHRT